MPDHPVDDYGRSLGWCDDLEDRDALKAESLVLCCTAPFQAPSKIDMRGILRVENQGPIGSCSGNARTTVEECCMWLASGGRHKPQFSRMGAYLAAQKLDGLLGNDRGATISGQAKAAKQFGTCDESVFPYPSGYTSRIPDAYWGEAAKRQTRNTVKLHNYHECREFLARGIGGIVIGIPWLASLANSKGLIEQASGKQYGGHALAIVGYLPGNEGGKSDNQGRPYLLMLNSHGTQWGREGWAIVAPSLFDRWGHDGYSEMIGFSDLENPNDPDFDQRRWWTGDVHPFA